MFLIFFSLFHWLSFSFALKIYSTLKIFLLSVQNNYIEFTCRRARAKKKKKKKSNLNFMSMVGFKASKIWLFFPENLQSTFSNYFQAEIIPWSSISGFELNVITWSAKIEKHAGEHPLWFSATSRNFEAFTPLNPLKLYFGVFLIKSDWSKFQLIEVACSSVKRYLAHYI